jgi:murein L,D-transpeptidase YafK
VPVHSFPFRMTAERMEQAALEPWSAFWQNLRLGHDYFSRNGRPPAVSMREGRYEFR